MSWIKTQRFKNRHESESLWPVEGIMNRLAACRMQAASSVTTCVNTSSRLARVRVRGLMDYCQRAIALAAGHTLVE